MLRKKVVVFKGNRVSRMAEGLPSNIAASIGRIIARYTYLETNQAKVIYWLLCISPKQGRLAARIPQSRGYTQLIEDLLLFHSIRTNYPFRQLYKALEKAERARNLLAHSVYTREKGEKEIYLTQVRGSWDLGQDTESYSRALMPEKKLVDRVFLANARKDIENAITITRQMSVFVKRLLQALNEKRRTGGAPDRRRPLQSVDTPPDPPRSSQA